MRQRYCKECGGWHELDKWPVECWEKRNASITKRADFGFPMINTSDGTEPLRSQADGKLYTSKAAMRESYKAANNPKGIDYQEVGDDPAYLNPKPKEMPKSDTKAIREAIARASADMNR